MQPKIFSKPWAAGNLDVWLQCYCLSACKFFLFSFSVTNELTVFFPSFTPFVRLRKSHTYRGKKQLILLVSNMSFLWISMSQRQGRRAVMSLLYGSGSPECGRSCFFLISPQKLGVLFEGTKVREISSYPVPNSYHLLFPSLLILLSKLDLLKHKT